MKEEDFPKRIGQVVDKTFVSRVFATLEAGDLLDECLERIDNGKSFVCSDKPRQGNYPAVLKLSAATYGDYRPNENKALLVESQFVEGAEVHSGDLLFTRKNTPELVGMAAYVQETPEKLMMPDLIFRLVTNEKMNPVFLWQLINCKEFRPVIQGIAGGSAKSMSNISKERLGKVRVICPPRKLQDELIPFIVQICKARYKIAHLNKVALRRILFQDVLQQPLNRLIRCPSKMRLYRIVRSDLSGRFTHGFQIQLTCEC